MSEVQKYTCAVARAVKSGDEDAIPIARQELAVAKISIFIQETLAATPVPLTSNQLAGLRKLILEKR